MEQNSPFVLTPYERERRPIELLDDAYIILNCPEEFKCSICWRLFRDIHITKDCLHRFCRDCIITALRQGNKECPVCRGQLVSKRDLRPDNEFDAMLQIFYPDREIYDRSNQDKIERILAESFIALDLTPKVSKRGKKPGSVSTEEIELELIPRPLELNNDNNQTEERRFFKVPKVTSIEHLKHLFSNYPTWNHDSTDVCGDSQMHQYYIYSYSQENDEYSRLPDHIKMSDIYKDSDSHLVLYYQHFYDLYGDFSFE